MRVKLEAMLVGVAGEYLVAGELTLRGLVAAITLRNSRGIDIVVSSADGKRSATVQVKTNSDGSSKWILTKKSEDYHADSHYYVFVALTGIGSRPRFHIVPSAEVARRIYQGHRDWLASPKADGTSRKDSSIRNFFDPDGEFLERWDLIAI